MFWVFSIAAAGSLGVVMAYLNMSGDSENEALFLVLLCGLIAIALCAYLVIEIRLKLLRRNMENYLNE